MKKRVLAIAATAMATMMMASPVMAQDFKIGICNYVDDASLNQIVDNIQSRLEEIGKEKDVNFDVSYDNCNADANVMEQIISDFQADNVDLMVGIATPVAMRMQSATEGTDTPVVFSAVSDPEGRSCRGSGCTWSKHYRYKRLSGYSIHHETDPGSEPGCKENRTFIRYRTGFFYNSHSGSQGLSG